MKLKFENVVIIGPGLIGGSIGILLRKLKIASNVIGVVFVTYSPLEGSPTIISDIGGIRGSGLCFKILEVAKTPEISINFFKDATIRRYR